MRRDNGYVYCAMQVGTDVCKIGMTTDSEKRVKNLNNGSPVPLQFEIVKVKSYTEAEKYLHRFFCKRRMHGEWFKGVTVDEFKSAIAEYIEKKKRENLDTMAFYRWLYNTDYEMIHGVPIRVWDLLRKGEYHIMVYVDKHVTSGRLFREKMDNILNNISKKSTIYIYVGNKSAFELVKWYKRLSTKIIFLHSFTDYYDMHANGFLEVCEDFLEDCYGLINYVENETYFTKKLTEYSLQKGLKVRNIIASKILQTTETN